MSRRTSVVIAVLLGVAGVSAIYLWLREPSPSRVLQEFLDDVAGRRWAQVYEYSSEEERSWTGLTNERFVLLMKIVERGLAPGALEKPSWSERNIIRESSRTYDVVFPNAADLPKTSGMARNVDNFRVQRSRDGWKVTISHLPMLVAGLSRVDEHAVRRKVASALREVGMPEYKMFMVKATLLATKLEEAAAGRRDPRMVYKETP